MKSRRLTVTVASVLMTGVALAGCSSSSVAPNNAVGEPKSGGTLSWAVTGETASMDPAVCSTVAPPRCSTIFGTLLRYDNATAEFTPYLAESFESVDGQKWTLKLREGVTFSDGTPFDAAAVVFNWDRIKNPQTLSPAIRATNGMTWQVVDPLTVNVMSESPNYQLPWQLVKGLGAIGSPTAIQAAGAEVGNTPVGAGPFVLTRWTRGTQMELTRNPTYFEQGLPYLDGLTTKVINSEDQRLNALRSGEVEVATSSFKKDTETVAGIGGYDIYDTPLVGGTGLMFNYTDPALQDQDLRQAIQHAIDGSQINNAVAPGEAAADTFVRTDDHALGTFPALDLSEAQRLFDKYLKKTGKTGETISLLTYAGFPVMEQTSQLLQAQLQEIDGLTVRLEPVDNTTMLKRKRQREYQIVVTANLSEDLDSLYDMFHSDGALNAMGYSNPKVDEALDITRASANPDEVTSAYQVVNGEISKDAPFRIWQNISGYLYADDKVEGIAATGTAAGAAFQWERAWFN
ncbi:ABC transporter substrate-binding protein [Rhodococcus globerulus]|uniref:ABC transporter substrate-binding protein n=1 Tax=Rhodococcus globerulus TaxID=33008 RepID=UPI000A422F9C|nr:ABC transporter substrate-binding protein [Rhodococcus globerulus]